MRWWAGEFGAFFSLLLDIIKYSTTRLYTFAEFPWGLNSANTNLAPYRSWMAQQ
jgi:hypothetical protein